MSAVRSLLEVAVRAGQAWQRAPVWSQNDATEVTPVMVPIRSLGPTNRARIASHLLALDAQDRYLRFGYTATDEQIQRYVDRINFDQDLSLIHICRRSPYHCKATGTPEPGWNFSSCGILPCSKATSSVPVLRLQPGAGAHGAQTRAASSSATATPAPQFTGLRSAKASRAASRAAMNDICLLYTSRCV